ncbi:MAG: hypothetical protein P8X46_06120, partial [Nitrospirales bacterium]
GLFFVAIASSMVGATDQITLGQMLYFLSPEGKAVELVPGNYEVSQGESESSDILLLKSPSGSFRVQAKVMEHEGEFTSPMALSMPETDDQQVVLLLLPNGTGLEAVGSKTLVQSRGITGGTSKPAGVRRALATVRPGMKPPSNQGSSDSSGAPLPASKTPSTELQQINQHGKPSGKPRRPSSSQLLDMLRGFPGGKESIERAKAGGARISLLDEEQDETLLSWLNPFSVSAAFAQGAFSVSLSPGQPMAGPNYLSFSSVEVRNNASIGFHSAANPASSANSKGYIWVQIPSTGWYIINIEAESNYKNAAELKHFNPGSSWWTNEAKPPVQTWYFPQSQLPVVRSYPALVHLQGGNHEFLFRLKEGFLTFLEVTVKAM